MVGQWFWLWWWYGFQSFCGYGAFAVAKGLVYASTAYVNDPDDFLGTKLVLLSCIIGERRKRQGQEISIVIEWTSFRNKLCKCCWSFWMISKRNRALFGVGDLTIPLYHGIAYLSLSGTNWLCLEVPWVQWSWRARWGDLTVSQIGQHVFGSGRAMKNSCFLVN